MNSTSRHIMILDEFSFKRIPLTLQRLTSRRINNAFLNYFNSKKEYLNRNCITTFTTDTEMASWTWTKTNKSGL